MKTTTANYLTETLTANAPKDMSLWKGQHNTVEAMTAWLKANAETVQEVSNFLKTLPTGKKEGFTGRHAKAARRMAQLQVKIGTKTVKASSLWREHADVRLFWLA